jgi:hypothetical protein
MASKIDRDSIRKAIETCERYQKGMNLSDVRVTNLRIGKGTVAADVTVIDDDGRTKKLRNRYDIFSL